MKLLHAACFSEDQGQTLRGSSNLQDLQKKEMGLSPSQHWQLHLYSSS